jgi:hypothetical protein
MKTIHILNIGYPKCGTTWLWKLISQQPWFATFGGEPWVEKENTKLIRGVAVSEYIKPYTDHDITANFAPSNFAIDRYIIKQLSELPTVQLSIILRNPYDLYWSLYNFLPNPTQVTYNNFIINLSNQSWFTRPAHVIKRWQQFFGKDRFCIFFYDDLQKNSSDFFNNYCKQMRLPDPVISDIRPKNVTRYTHTDMELDSNLIVLINQEIDNLQACVDYDVLKWKQ